MEFRKVRALRGPNIWAGFPVLEGWLDLGALKESPSDELPGFNERLMSWLPSLVEHRCSVGTRGGFFERLRRGTYQGHILEHVALELQTLAGTDVGYGRTRESNEEGVYKVVIEYEYEELGRASLEVALRLCLAAVHDTPFDVAAEIDKLRELARSLAPAPSMAAILEAARKRRIPVRRLGPDGPLQLGWGARQQRIWNTQTSHTSAIAEAVARDNDLTRSLLRATGIPVPAGRLATDPEDAWQAAQDLGLPVIVRPRHGASRRALRHNLTTREEVLAACAAVNPQGGAVLVERFQSGADYRLLVVADRLVAAVRRDRVASAEQSCTCQSGGSRSVRIVDVTDEVHADVAAHAVEAARTLGLVVAGIDVVATDISQPLESQGGAVVGVQPRPGLRVHLQPDQGKPRPVGQAILETLFPEGQTGRIPVVGVTGVNGKTTTTRLIAHIVGRTHRPVGMTCTEGIYVDGRRIEEGDCSGPRSAGLILQNPLVQAGVFEVARGGILREGLGFDRCDVAVVTNIGEGDHLGIGDIESPGQLARVKGTLVETVSKTGNAVLNAADPLVAEMANRCPGSVVFFALDSKHPVMEEHRGRGGRVAFVRDTHLVLAEGSQEIPLVALKNVPLTHGGKVSFQVQNALAAAAAAWSLGIPCEAIRSGLETFAADLDRVPARFNLLDVNGAVVILDYGHNVSSLACLIEAIDQLPACRRLVVYSAAGDRRDQDLIRQGELLGHAFDHVILFEDISCSRGRPDGEIFRLFREGLKVGHRVGTIHDVPGALRSLEVALETVRPGELLMVQVDIVDASIEHVKSRLARGTARQITFRDAQALIEKHKAPVSARPAARPAARV